MRGELLTSEEFSNRLDRIIEEFENIPVDDMVCMIDSIHVTPRTEAYVYALRDACIKYSQRFKL